MLKLHPGAQPCFKSGFASELTEHIILREIAFGERINHTVEVCMNVSTAIKMICSHMIRKIFALRKWLRKSLKHLTSDNHESCSGFENLNRLIEVNLHGADDRIEHKIADKLFELIRILIGKSLIHRQFDFFPTDAFFRIWTTDDVFIR